MNNLKIFFKILGFSMLSDMMHATKMPLLMEQNITYQYSSNKCAKVGGLLGGCMGGQLDLPPPHQEDQFFLLGILEHLV